MKIEFGCIADFKRWFKKVYGYDFGDTFANGNPLTLPGCNAEAAKYVRAETGRQYEELKQRFADLGIELPDTYRPKV